MFASSVDGSSLSFSENAHLSSASSRSGARNNCLAGVDLSGVSAGEADCSGSVLSPLSASICAAPPGVLRPVPLTPRPGVLALAGLGGDSGAPAPAAAVGAPAAGGAPRSRGAQRVLTPYGRQLQRAGLLDGAGVAPPGESTASAGAFFTSWEGEGGGSIVDQRPSPVCVHPIPRSP
jgi:hypothetical protein